VTAPDRGGRLMRLGRERRHMTRRETIPVSGMSCDGCERSVENALQSVDGVRRVEADHGGDTVEVVVDDDVADDEVRTAIQGAGFDVAA